jgi:nitrite reductase/ring-hydroxylating ferredoxin subunit
VAFKLGVGVSEMPGIPDLAEWVPVGLGASLSPAAVQRCLVLGQDLAVWRGKDCLVRAWENRCPHRGMRLSFGFVRENKLSCVYHGWTYNGAGTCVFIPAHPSLEPPKTIKVEKFSCAESNGLIWVASEGIAGSPPSADGNWTACRSITVEVPASLVAEALSKAVFLPFSNSKPADVQAGSEFNRYSACLHGSDVAYESRFVSTHLLHVRSGAGEAILCGIQSVAEKLTTLHLLIAGAFGDADVPRARLHYAKWAKRLRLYLESGEIAQDGPHPWLTAA